MRIRNKKLWGRLLGWLRFRWNEAFSRPITVGSLISFLFLTVAVVSIGVGPMMRMPGYSWLEASSWKNAVSFAWPVMIATFVLRHVDGIKKQRKGNAVTAERTRRRKLYIATALGDADARDSKSKLRTREMMLECASLKVADIIGELRETQVVASLLEFIPSDSTRMRVTARSHKARRTPITHLKSSLVAWRAIEHGKLVVLDDTRQKPEFDDVTKTYRSILSLPIVRDGNAIGAISFDHPRPYAFFAKLQVIEECIQPYLAALLLTFPKEVSTISCQYDPVHAL